MKKLQENDHFMLEKDLMKIIVGVHWTGPWYKLIIV